MTKINKHLTDADIDRMGLTMVSLPEKEARRKIVAELDIKRRMTRHPVPPLAPDSFESARIFYEQRMLTLDLHGKTVEQAWDLITALFRQSRGRRLRIITGASGILRVQFQDWITRGLLADDINEWSCVNRGAFDIRLKK